MQTTFINSELAHIWVSRNQLFGRNQNNSFYFRGNIIYSYGSHFPIAMRIDDNTVLMTTDSYSNTTARHIHHVRCAIRHLKTFNVPNILATTKAEHKANFEDYRERYEQQIINASRARALAASYLIDAAGTLKEANEYSRFFKIRVQLKETNHDDIIKRAKKQRAKELRAVKIRQRKTALEHKKHLINWRNGNTSFLPHAYSQPVALRLIDNGETVQTSHGARFPTKHAKRALPLVHRCVKRKQSWLRNGESIQLGPYQIDVIKANGYVKAGCHNVAYEEIQHLETLINQKENNS